MILEKNSNLINLFDINNNSEMILKARCIGDKMIMDYQNEKKPFSVYIFEIKKLNKEKSETFEFYK